MEIEDPKIQPAPIQNENNFQTQIQQQQQKSEDEDDDWNPTFSNKETVLNKLKVDYTDKKIRQIQKKIEEKQQKAQENSQNNKKQSQTFQKDAQNFSIPNPKNKNQNQEKKCENFMKDDFFDSDDEEIKQKLQEKPEFYDPFEDDKYEEWVSKNLKKDEKSKIILNCPSCFAHLCYDCQAHEVFEHQYRAVFVKNIQIDMQKVVFPEKKENNNMKKKKQQFHQKVQKIIQENKSNTFLADLNKNEKFFTEQELQDNNYLNKLRPEFEIFFATNCDVCKTEVGVFEADSKVYIFHNVVPSLG